MLFSILASSRTVGQAFVHQAFKQPPLPLFPLYNRSVVTVSELSRRGWWPPKGPFGELQRLYRNTVARKNYHKRNGNLERAKQEKKLADKLIAPLDHLKKN